MKKIIIMFLTLVMLLTSGMFSSVASAEASEDSSWLNDFNYNIRDNTLVVNEYVGPNTDVVISTPVTVDGVEYAVSLAPGLFASRPYSTTGAKVRKITSITINGPVKLPEDCSYMFGNENANDVLTSIYMPDIDASAVKKMDYMFNRQKGLKTLVFGNMDTSNVETMENMFAQCTSLTSLDVSHFNTSKVTNMAYMFSFLYDVPVIDVSGFDTSNVEYMTRMFISCHSVRKLDVSHFNTSRVLDMNAMFDECIRVPYLDLSSFDTSKVSNMGNMFGDCSLLAYVDLSSFDTSKVQSFGSMFYRCNSLNKIRLGEGWTNWNGVKLPAGNWTHEGLSKSETELATEYPDHITEWKGHWYRDMPVERIFGANRVLTSVQAAEFRRDVLGFYGPDQLNNVVLASGDDFADALAGAYLANTLDCPILLLRKGNKNLQAILEFVEVNLNTGGTTYVLGGTAAVPDEWLAELKENLTMSERSIERIQGSNRFNTNIEILKKAGFNGGEIFVATADNYADSLSASATDRPILLVRGDSVRSNQAAYLKTFNGNLQFVILGGTSAVTQALEADLKNYGTVKERIAGDNRYETSVLIAEKYFDNPQRAVLAYGKEFPDGLSGGPVAYQLQCPLILLQDNKQKHFCKDYLNEHDICTGYVLGGPGLLSDALVKEVFDTDLDVKVYGE